jgi:hypothetical protein
LVVGTIRVRRYEDGVIDLVQDNGLGSVKDWRARPMFFNGRRVLGPFSSAMWWQLQEYEHPGKTVVGVIVYSDATEFFKGESAHPIFSKCCSLYQCMCSRLCVLHT